MGVRASTAVIRSTGSKSLEIAEEIRGEVHQLDGRLQGPLNGWGGAAARAAIVAWEDLKGDLRRLSDSLEVTGTHLVESAGQYEVQDADHAQALQRSASDILGKLRATG